MIAAQTCSKDLNHSLIQKAALRPKTRQQKPIHFIAIYWSAFTYVFLIILILKKYYPFSSLPFSCLPFFPPFLSFPPSFPFFLFSFPFLRFPSLSFHFLPLPFPFPFPSLSFLFLPFPSLSFHLSISFLIFFFLVAWTANKTAKLKYFSSLSLTFVHFNSQVRFSVRLGGFHPLWHSCNAGHVHLYGRHPMGGQKSASVWGSASS